MTPIAPLIEAFLDETLARQRGASRHTCDSYALSFQLLFVFAAKRLKISPSALTLEQLDAGLIGAFLEYLEDKRKNAPVTRNVWLAAITLTYPLTAMSLAHLGRIEEARATMDRTEEEFGENLRRYLQRPPWLRPEDYVVRVEGLRLMGLQE